VDKRDRYSIPELKAIAKQYEQAYSTGFYWYDPYLGNMKVGNTFRIAEMRVDFMRAFKKCGLDYEKMKKMLNGGSSE
jgi:hypothetical protein